MNSFPRMWIASCCGLLAWTCAVEMAGAGPVFDPYVGVQVEHNTNLFNVAPQYALVNPQGVPTLGDTLTTFTLGTESSYLYDRQRFYATLEVRRTLYDEFTELNHNEYKVDLGWKWRITNAFDGVLDAGTTKAIVNFVNRDATTTLTTQTDKNAKGSFNVSLGPLWRVESNVLTHTTDSPLPTAPDFSLHETTEGVDVMYAGSAKLAYGVGVNHTNGAYSGAPGAVDYRQNTAQLTMTYQVTGSTDMNGAVGYTQRKLDGVSGTVSGVTGTLGYVRRITGKTTINIQAMRAVNSYYNSGGSEIDTSASLGLTWQTTRKLGLSVNYQYTHSQFEGQALPDAATQGRVDSLNYYGLDMQYQLRPWALIHAYGKRQLRDSNINQYTFNSSVYGIEIRFRNEKPKGTP